MPKTQKQKEFLSLLEEAYKLGRSKHDMKDYVEKHSRSIQALSKSCGQTVLFSDACLIAAEAYVVLARKANE